MLIPPNGVNLRNFLQVHAFFLIVFVVKLFLRIYLYIKVR